MKFQKWLDMLLIMWFAAGQEESQIQHQQNSYPDHQIQLHNCPDLKGRNILIDLGANCGNSFEDLVTEYGAFDHHFLWELNPMLIEQLKKLAANQDNVTLVPYGAWYEHTTMELNIMGKSQDVCDPSKSFWEDTTIVHTGEKQKHNKAFQASVQAETRDFVAWYKHTICLQDKVTLKIDIEKAEYAVLGNMCTHGLICHPYRLLVEFHVPEEPLKVNQRFSQQDINIDQDKKQDCFAAGFVSTLEFIVQFCDDEPELVRWD
eukprot:TRINITY_DN1608_c0_g1_i7.p2 TRINITY_DN1608_c0_g1~~TRINITY_DN1608_c0_g1_i7.p2  ORF type:complete len:261 (-),score=31.68 TRINITY_DN1608_c0_g1_i7:2273-3055(-)